MKYIDLAIQFPEKKNMESKPAKFGSGGAGLGGDMKAYRISGLKSFMNKLLLTDSFDYFLLEEGTVVTSNAFQIDGHIQKDFYTKEEQEDAACCPYEFAQWKDMRPFCFQLIKGKRTPLSFKFVLLLAPEHMERILAGGGFEDHGNLVKAFTLSVKYDGLRITLVTGLSTNTFLMDKTPEQLWDKAFLKFMERKEILWEEV